MIFHSSWRSFVKIPLHVCREWSKAYDLNMTISKCGFLCLLLLLGSLKRKYFRHKSPELPSKIWIIDAGICQLKWLLKNPKCTLTVLILKWGFFVLLISGIIRAPLLSSRDPINGQRFTSLHTATFYTKM